jgi:hypothetical protein
VPYCVLDWHVLVLAWFDIEFTVPDLGITWTTRDARTWLASLDMEFSLDGEVVDTSRTPVERYLASDPAEVEAYLEDYFGTDVVVGNDHAVQFGRILAPDELSVGQHTLRVITSNDRPEPTYPDGWISDDSVTFTVYPADSEACTGSG